MLFWGAYAYYATPSLTEAAAFAVEVAAAATPVGVDELIAGWSHDPVAPAWLNRLEDRLTTTGTWHARPLRGIHATNGAKAG